MWMATFVLSRANELPWLRRVPDALLLSAACVSHDVYARVALFARLSDATDLLKAVGVQDQIRPRFKAIVQQAIVAAR